MRLTTRFGSLAAIAALVLIAGCSGGGSTTPSGTFTQQQTTHLSQLMSFHRATHKMTNIASATGIVPLHQRHIPSHFVAGKPITDTVFTSDFGNSAVYLESFPALTQIGTNSNGLLNPQGMWLDHSANLWVADTGNSNILEFAKPWTGSASNSLSDPGMFPTDVTMDASGNCYVSNIESTSGGAGSEVMYTGCSGSGTTLNMSGACFLCYFTAVDKSGNVWVDGEDSSFLPTIGYWGPGGSGTFTKLNFTFNFPGGIAFDRKGNMILDDQLGDNFAASEAYVFAPGSSSPFAQFPLQNDGSDVVTIALGTVQKRLFDGDANFVNFCAQPILTYPAGSIVNSFLADGGACSEPIGVAANPPTH